MSTRKFVVSLLLLIVLLLALTGVAAAQEPPKGPDPLPTAPAPPPDITPLSIDPTLLFKIDPDLLKQLLVGDTGTAPFIVYLTAQANTEAAAAAAALNSQSEPEPLAKRRAIVDELQRTAQSSQAGVLQLLNSPAPGGVGAAASDVTPLWIVNGVAASGPLETVLALAARADVRQVRLDRTISLTFEPTEVSDQPFSLLPSVEWGISKIRADLAQNALGFDGSGVVVGNIDSGVDWLHPALQSQYRGYTGPTSPPNHAGNWFDATGAGASYPVDSMGHGTHTMGTAVGNNGIGVAPGAQWIAARTFDSNGNGLNSWLHLAFQWMLAPNGNPALAPDVVNNSWGSDNGFSTEFKADIDLLRAAGIFPVFSAGNNGPGSGTVGSPASSDNAFAVGATTSGDEIAVFSSRGPSPWGEIKPQVSAPGVDVRSALPGGTYGSYNGTSMAAPHVSGLAALLLQASPALSTHLNDLADTLKSTAVPLGDPIPNNNFGWGRIDAYNALLAVTHQSSVSGTVTQAGSGAPISGAVVSFVPALGGPSVSAVTGSGGAYTMGLQPDFYDAAASAFGYTVQTVKLVEVITGTAVTQNFSLSPAPTGVLAGSIIDKASGLPLSATVRIEGTPVTTVAASGSFNLSLPVGVYTATVIAPAHRISRAVGINISAGSTVVRNFALESAPEILLVDSGNWYQQSRLTYFQQALEDALYPFDTWQLQGQVDDFYLAPTHVPTTTDLLPYDIVVWSSPLYSPGFEGADAAIRGYLDGGGKLLLSGKNVAFFDGGGYLGRQPYFINYLKARYVADVANADTVTGAPGEPFTGLAFTIAGGDGSDDQAGADVIGVEDEDFASPLLQYGSGDTLAGLHVGRRCLPYRAILLAFGLEGVNTRADRSQLMSQSIDLLQLPPASGIELSPAEALQVGNFGGVASHTLRLRNISAITDTISLTVSGLGPYNWPVGGLPATDTLSPCAIQTYTATVQVPAVASWHITDSFRVQAQSGNAPAVTQVVTRHTKTPAPVLLVDDDRFYSFADSYKTALAAGHIPFDYYQVPKSWSGAVPPSPSLATLQMYPITVWYTAYDWYQPLIPEEELRLMSYLDGGGRLFFSSQDFLYRYLINHNGNYDGFARDYLGVAAHIEDNASTLMLGQNDNPLATQLGPYPFTFPAGYQNWTDSLTPTTTAQVASVGQAAQPNSITHGGKTGGQWWRTHFLSFGPEVMANPADHARLMQRSVGWLSWLGASEISVVAPTVANGDVVTFTAVISNNGWNALSTATFTATFPAYLSPETASSGLSPVGNDWVWSGPLGVGASQKFTYTARINQDLPLGSVISQTSWLAYSNHNLLFERVAAVEVAPNFSGSSMAVWPAQEVAKNDVLTYTIVLKNEGTTDSPLVTVTNRLPATLEGLAVLPPASGAVLSSGNSFTWTTTLARNQSATLTFRATISDSGLGAIRNSAHVSDGVHSPLTLSAEAWFKAQPIYLPVISKNGTH